MNPIAMMMLGMMLEDMLESKEDDEFLEEVQQVVAEEETHRLEDEELISEPVEEPIELDTSKPEIEDEEQIMRRAKTIKLIRSSDDESPLRYHQLSNHVSLALDHKLKHLTIDESLDEENAEAEVCVVQELIRRMMIRDAANKRLASTHGDYKSNDQNAQVVSGEDDDVLEIVRSDPRSGSQSVNQSSDDVDYGFVAPKNQLESLRILITTLPAPLKTPKHKFPDVTLLTQSRCLHTLVIDTDMYKMDAEDYQKMIKSMPPSLTHLSLPEAFSYIDEHAKRVWNRCLMMPDFLPIIKHIKLGKKFSDAISTGPWLSVLASTTHQPRPLETISIRIEDDSIRRAQLDSLKSLTLNVGSTGFGIFTSLPDDAMFLLEEVVIGHHPSIRPVRILNILPILEFLVTRSIQTFALQLAELPVANWSPLSDECVHLLGEMLGLRSLKWTLPVQQQTSVRLSSNKELDIGVGCWPYLSQLDLDNCSLSIKQVESLVKAAPNLVDVTIGGSERFEPHLHVRSLALIGIHCPLVEKVNLWGHQKYRPALLSQMRTWYEDCPSFQRLQELTLITEPIRNESLHLIVSKLNEAPLTTLNLDKSTDPKFRAALLRPLVHLSRAPLEFTRNTSQLRSRKMSNGQKYPFFESETPNDENYHLSNEFVTFNGQLDERGKSARENFFEKLDSSLNDAEKRRIDAWNSGDHLIDNYDDYAKF